MEKIRKRLKPHLVKYFLAFGGREGPPPGQLDNQKNEKGTAQDGEPVGHDLM